MYVCTILYTLLRSYTILTGFQYWCHWSLYWQGCSYSWHYTAWYVPS